MTRINAFPFLRACRALILASGLAACTAFAGEISFNERFALAPDRAVPLAELIPGTEDYYVYNALDRQLSGRFDEARTFIDDGIRKYNRTARLRELENRQALFEYERNPKKSLDYIIDELDLQFSHQRKQLNPEVNLPTRLDPAVLSFDRLTKWALSDPRTLSRFEDRALESLASAQLTGDQQRHLLSRIRRPDFPGLVDRILADLDFKDSGGFGSIPIHRELSVEQLEACVARRPGLIQETDFIQTYLAKLRPDEDVDWANDPTALSAYLDRLEAFVDRLPPSQNSLKANVLFQRLELERRQGRYDRARFVRYLALPRPVFYANRESLRRIRGQDELVNLNESFNPVTALPPIGEDEPLVRDYLAHFLRDAPDEKAFAEWIESNYLRRLFAETKLVSGIGSAEAWYALLPPAEVKAIRDRVDLEWRPTNPTAFAEGDPVALDVAVKNVEELRIKIYEINTTAAYRRNPVEITTAVELDGLVANRERVLAYRQPPMIRHAERLEFPELAKPGVYVVELIGNGVSSRALVRKGRLSYTERIGAAGHAFRIYNERGEPLPAATLWLGGREFTAGKDGEVRVPFSSRPRREPIVLTHGDFSTLTHFDHLGESYELTGGFHLGRERLVAGEQTRLAVRVQLTLNDEPVPLKLLENPVLVLRSADLDGLCAEKQVKAPELLDDRETTHEFRVPDRLRTLEVVLHGTVRSQITGEPVPVEMIGRVALNGIQETDKVEDLYLRRTSEGYSIELLGRTGEPRPDRALQLQFKPRDFTETVHATLKTDATGRALLGGLEGMEWVIATGPEQTEHTWPLPRDRNAAAGDVHMLAGDKVRVSVMEADPAKPIGGQVSLLERRGGGFARDAIAKAALEPGYVVIGPLEPGDYSLYLKAEEREVAIRVTAGTAVGTQLLGRDRALERRSPAPLQIGEITPMGDALNIRILHPTPGTRVHVGATRYVTDDLLAQFGAPVRRPPVAARMTRPESSYLSGRNLGDEFRYVVERRGAKIFPGNMLTRPSLLLNPWSPRVTETGTDEAQIGGDYASVGRGAALKKYAGRMAGLGGGAGGEDDLACFDFLPGISPLAVNLVPGKDGIIKVPLKDLPAGQQVMVYAVNAEGAVCRHVPLAERPEKPRDLRLARYLDPGSEFTEQKRVSVVRKGDVFTVGDVLSAKVEWVDSLASAYRLLAALKQDAAFDEFSFLLEWPKLDAARKRELYKKFACHELHLFLAKKDPAFFQEAVAPYLASKKDPTFMDNLLLERPLDAYLEPWAFARLNAAERALLARRLADRHDALARHVADRFDLILPDTDRLNRLFDTALRSGGLESDAQLDAVVATAAAAEQNDRNEEGGFLGLAAGGGKAAHRKLKQRAPAPSAPKSASVAKNGGRERKDADKWMADGKELEPADILFDSPEEEKAELAKEDSVELAEMQEASKLADLEAITQLRAFFRRLDPPREWVESNYYHLPIEQQAGDLVPVNAFWRDYAAGGPDGFLSGHLAEVGTGTSEMILALAVLDLPFEAAEHELRYEKGGMTIRPANDLILYHRQVQAAKPAEGPTPLLLSQNFIARNDPFRFEGNERFDKFITGKYEKGRVYGAQIVLTNPTSTRRRIDVLLQIPAGAIPVLKGQPTASRFVTLEPFSSRPLEYFFYFPFAGTFEHYPVRAAQSEQVVAAAAPVRFEVVDRVTDLDTGSWEHISQFAGEAETLAYLREHNIDRLDLGLIAWRVRDRAFFGQALDLLRGRHVYHETLWSYGLLHNDPVAIREYLTGTPYAGACGPLVESQLLTLDAIERRLYEHKEYWPLVNARVFKLGRERKILNREFYEQYEAFMQVLSYRAQKTDEDRMAVCVYLLLQDRVEEAMGFFDAVAPEKVAMKVPYDYLAAYLAFTRERPADARRIASSYREYPVERWRKLFGEVLAQCDEIEGGAAAVADPENRDQRQEQFAATEPRLDLTVEGDRVELQFANLDACEIRFYPMDLELLFSQQPFVQDLGDRFAMIRPLKSETLRLKGPGPTPVVVPKELAGRNLMIEAVGKGISKLAAYYPNAFDVAVVETYGQLKVTDRKTGRPLPKVYVKVYARGSGGKVSFYKDGYTDLRGRFDYTSLNTGEIDGAERFALLILSESHGAVVREAAPPKQ